MSDSAESVRWWLSLQLGLGVAGASAWLMGAIVGQEFIAGTGLGLLLGALVLRIGRSRAEREGPD